MSATRIDFTDISELTPAQAYEQGFLDAYRHMQLPLLRVPEYKALSEEKRNAAPGCAGEPKAPEMPAPSPSSASVAFAAVPTALPESVVDRAELSMALMYWMDLLSDADALSQSVVAERIARDMGKDAPDVIVVPRSAREFIESAQRMPPAQLERYLQRYGVVPGPADAQSSAGSLLDQLKRLQRVPEIRELERIDEQMIVRKPWA